MTEWIIYLLISIALLICLIFSAFFSAAETAYTSLSPATIEINSKKNVKAGKLIQKHVHSYSWTLSTILVGNNLVNVALSTLTSTMLSMMLVGRQDANLLSTIIPILVVTPILVLFGEILPKIYAKKYSWKYLLAVVYLMEGFKWMFFIFTYPLSKIASKAKITNTEDELKSILNIGYQEGVLERSEVDLARNALDLDSAKVKKHYINIKNIEYIESEWTLEEIKEKFKTSGFTRLPIKDKNTWLGIVHLKDIWAITENEFDLKNFIIEVPIVTINMNLHSALDKMRQSGKQMVFVQSSMNSNKIEGILTFEDIVEELVGEVYDEHDDEKIRLISPTQIIVSGDVLVSEVQENINKLEFDFINLKHEELTISKWLKLNSKKNLKKSLAYIYQNKLKFKVIENKKSQEAKILISYFDKK